MSPENKGRIFMVDMETFGLHYLNDPVLEIGLSVTDLQLNEIDQFHALVWDDPYYQMLMEKHEQENSIVWQMHNKSGLWDDAFRKGLESKDVEDSLLYWLEKHEVDPKNDYLAGSSVHFDSTMMFFNFPKVRARFHHRVIDTSSIKVMTEIFFPNIATRLKKEVIPEKNHRVIPDIDDTANELEWYLKNVLPEGDEPNA